MPTRRTTTRQKAGQKSGAAGRSHVPGPGPLVKQPHGGAIYQGPPAHPVPGSGRPPSLIRERLRGSFDERIAILEQIADGAPMEHTLVSLAAVAPYLCCPDCEGPLEFKDPEMALLISVEARRSARAKDRRDAIETMGKFGLGEKTELDIVHHPEAQRFATAYQQAARELLAPPAAEQLLRRVGELLGVAA